MTSEKQKKHHLKTSLWLGVILFFFSIIVAYPMSAFEGNFENNVLLEKYQGVMPNDKIVIIFSMPVATSSFEDKLSVSPMEEVTLSWQSDNKKLIISPKKNWKPEMQYSINIKNGRNIFFQKIEKELMFETEKYPKIVSIFPKSGEKNVSVSMEDPVSVNFDRALDNFSTKFVVSPDGLLEYQINDKKNQIKLLAKDDFKWKTDYKIEVFVKSKHQPNVEYVKIGQTEFQTESKPLPVEWDKDPSIRLEQVRQFTVPQVKTGKYIDINLAQQTMVIFENGVPLDSYLVSSGKRGMDTPEGNFKIENKATRPWSKKYSLFMPNWMAIVPSGEFGIHELPVWPGGYQEGASHLGTPVSHGCVRLGPGAAKRVYDWVEISTPVSIHR